MKKDFMCVTELSFDNIMRVEVMYKHFSALSKEFYYISLCNQSTTYKEYLTLKIDLYQFLSQIKKEQARVDVKLLLSFSKSFGYLAKSVLKDEKGQLSLTYSACIAYSAFFREMYSSSIECFES
jgi:hypothetical protein